MDKIKTFILKNAMLILGYVGLFLISTGGSLAAFTFLTIKETLSVIIRRTIWCKNQKQNI